jgi:diguanylate cyclase (GGDEF)-like protein
MIIPADETSAISMNVFKFLLESEGKRAARYGYFFSILSIELDQAENGEILKALVNLIRQTVRNSDLIGRVNSYRFLVILHDAEGLHVLQIGERIRNKVENDNMMQKEGGIQRTVSIGGACFPTHSNDTSDLLLTAHEMLLKAKSVGGNRVLLPEM